MYLHKSWSILEVKLLPKTPLAHISTSAIMTTLKKCGNLSIIYKEGGYQEERQESGNRVQEAGDGIVNSKR